jgi:hypothetical protein
MSAFAESFGEPFYFGDGVYALSAEAYPTETEAWAEFLESEGEEQEHWEVSLDRVRFRPTGQDDPGDLDTGQMGWWTGASEKRGSKPVWLFERLPVARRTAV